jgi:hypothetical protein
VTQLFNTRNYSIRDFEEWDRKGELELQPKFQRREVWVPKARSFLIDTIIRGKPIPKIFMRQDINPSNRMVTREVVDGQQRLRTILDYLKDGFPILKTHNHEYGGKYFSELDEDTQRMFLKYELAVDLLQDMSDKEIYDVFARLNTYSTVLNAQEQRNGLYFGEFKSAVYYLAKEFRSFFVKNNIFKEAQILRMVEAEFISELLIAISVGIQARSKTLIDKFYSDNEDAFPDREAKEDSFRITMDMIGGIIADTSPSSKLRESRFIYALFCAIYHMNYGLPKLEVQRVTVTHKDFAKIRVALGEIEEIFEKVQRANEEQNSRNAEERRRLLLQNRDETNAEDEDIDDVDFEYTSSISPSDSDLTLLTVREVEFYNAYNNRWVHAANRRLLTEYICGILLKTLKRK